MLISIQILLVLCFLFYILFKFYIDTDTFFSEIRGTFVKYGSILLRNVFELAISVYVEIYYRLFPLKNEIVFDSAIFSIKNDTIERNVRSCFDNYKWEKLQANFIPLLNFEASDTLFISYAYGKRNYIIPYRLRETPVIFAPCYTEKSVKELRVNKSIMKAILVCESGERHDITNTIRQFAGPANTFYKEIAYNSKISVSVKLEDIINYLTLTSNSPVFKSKPHNVEIKVSNGNIVMYRDFEQILI